MTASKKGGESKLVRFQVVGGFDDTAYFRQVREALSSKYGDVPSSGGFIDLRVDGERLQYQVESVEEFIVLTTSLSISAGKEGMISDGLRLLGELDSLVNPLSQVYSSFTILVYGLVDESHALAELDGYQRFIGRSKLGLGVVRGCLFSVFDSPDDKSIFDKHCFVSALEPRGSDARLDEVVGDIRSITLCSARLSQLHSKSSNLLSALQPGEVEISERTESYLWGLIQPEPVKLETLESWLGYIMEREASLSAMISTMRGNLLEAESILLRIKEFLRRLGERSYGDEPACLVGVLGEFERFPKIFADYIVRSEALKSRLGVVMDSVRTYLSIQQQRLTLEEQKASKEQLVRLVGLQEIFHKVEIFVLAVYMTEMARIVFEVVAEHDALLLTAVFIPVALVLAWVVTRLLHRK